MLLAADFERLRSQFTKRIRWSKDARDSEGSSYNVSACLPGWFV